MVSDARVEGRPIPLVVESTESTQAESHPHVLLSRQGRSALALDLVVPVAASGGSNDDLPASGSAVSRVTLTLPRGGVDLVVNGGFVTERAEAQAETRWTVHGRADSPMSLSWKRRADDRRVAQALRMRARIAELVTLGEEISTVAATIRLEVVQGLAREISLAMPEGLAISQVSGTTVGDWEAARGSLHVRLLEPSATDVSLTVHGELRAPRDGRSRFRWCGSSPPSAKQAAWSSTSQAPERFAIAGRAGSIRPIRRSSPRSRRAANRRRWWRSGSGRCRAAIRVRCRWTWFASIRRPCSSPTSRRRGHRAMASEDGRLLVEARYTVRNNQRSFLKFTLPAESTIWSAAVSGRPVKPGVAGTDSVLLPLQKGRASEEAPTFVVELLYLQHVRELDRQGARAADAPRARSLRFRGRS